MVDTLEALIKQIKAAPAKEADRLNIRALELASNRIGALEHCLELDLFKEATCLVFDANSELMRTLTQCKKLRRNMWLIVSAAAFVSGLLGAAAGVVYG